MATEKNKIIIDVDAKSGKTKLGEFNKELDKTSTTADKSGAGLLNFGTILKSAAVLGAITAVAGALKACISAAAEQEVIFNKLSNQMKIAGESYSGTTKIMVDEFLAGMQAVTIYGDTDVAPVLGKLTQLTGDLTASMELSKLAFDMQASGMMDANAAALLLARAHEGDVAALGRYVPELKESKLKLMEFGSESEKVAYAMEVLRGKFGGMAEGEPGTLIGAVQQFKNEFGDFTEKVGDPFLGFMTDAVQAMTSTVSGLNAFLDSVTKLTPEYIKQQQEATKELSKATKERDDIIRDAVDYKLATERKAAATTENDKKIHQKVMEDIEKKYFQGSLGIAKSATLAEHGSFTEFLDSKLDAAHESYKTTLKDKKEADILFAVQSEDALTVEMQIYKKLYNEMLASGEYTKEELKGYFKEYFDYVVSFNVPPLPKVEPTLPELPQFLGFIKDAADDVVYLQTAWEGINDILADGSVTLGNQEATYDNLLERALSLYVNAEELNLTVDQRLALETMIAEILERQNATTKDMTEALNDWQKVAVRSTRLFAGALIDSIGHANKMEDIFKNLLITIGKMVAKMLILKALGFIIGGPIGGALMHQGGIVMHQGGMIPEAHDGLFLRDDERLIKGQTGEGILTRRATAGIGGEPAINYINKRNRLPQTGGFINNGTVIIQTVNPEDFYKQIEEYEAARETY